jgi:hypothetical protein
MSQIPSLILLSLSSVFHPLIFKPILLLTSDLSFTVTIDQGSVHLLPITPNLQN